MYKKDEDIILRFEQVIELVKTVSDSQLTTFKYEEGDTKITMRTGETPTIVAPQMVASTVPNVVEVVPEVVEVVAGSQVVSPLVGTFYAAPSEEADSFVKVGDSVKKGQTLAIVEAMKLMNEIESDYDGIVVEILAENATSVEFGQPLFVIQ